MPADRPTAHRPRDEIDAFESKMDSRARSSAQTKSKPLTDSALDSWLSFKNSSKTPEGCSNSRNPWYPPSPGKPALSQNPKYDAEPRPASAEGTLPDVRGRPAGSCRHCVMCCCRLRMDFEHSIKGSLMAYPGRWVDLALWLHAVFLRI
jgi:hypothetical protein